MLAPGPTLVCRGHGASIDAREEPHQAVRAESPGRKAVYGGSQVIPEATR